MALSTLTLSRRATLRVLVVHLRLHFQLLLAPIFLVGWLLAGGGWSVGVALAFVAFHLFLYGGATALNSYYDRDEGPVGGLEKPPAVPAVTLPFSLAMQLLGWALALLVNLPFAVVYGVFFVLSLAYSHPSVRLKARPYASLAVVGFGQGSLAFLGAWTAVRGELTTALASSQGLLGLVAATLFTLGLYPLGQLFQVEEDRGRGDRTLAVVWSAPRCFLFSGLCQMAGGAALVAVLLERFGVIDAALAGLGVLAQLAYLTAWSRTFDPEAILANYRRVMRLNAISALGLGGYFLFRLAV